MTKFLCIALTLTLTAAPLGVATAKEAQKRSPAPVVEKLSPRGSIRPRADIKATERLALAKISFDDAAQAALKAVPGKVVYGELEVEDGNLQFDFQIITAAGKVMDVSIDAGDGKVLDVDVGDDE